MYPSIPSSASTYPPPHYNLERFILNTLLSISVLFVITLPILRCIFNSKCKLYLYPPTEQCKNFKSCFLSHLRCYYGLFEVVSIAPFF